MMGSHVPTPVGATANAANANGKKRSGGELQSPYAAKKMRANLAALTENHLEIVQINSHALGVAWLSGPGKMATVTDDEAEWSIPYVCDATHAPVLRHLNGLASEDYKAPLLWIENGQVTNISTDKMEILLSVCKELKPLMDKTVFAYKEREKQELEEANASYRQELQDKFQNDKEKMQSQLDKAMRDLADKDRALTGKEHALDEMTQAYELAKQTQQATEANFQKEREVHERLGRKYRKATSVSKKKILNRMMDPKQNGPAQAHI